MLTTHNPKFKYNKNRFLPTLLSSSALTSSNVTSSFLRHNLRRFLEQVLISRLCSFSPSWAVLPEIGVFDAFGNRKVVIFTFSLCPRGFWLDLCGGTLRIRALLCRFPTFRRTAGGFDHRRLPNAAREQISDSMRKGGLRSSLLPLRVWGWLIIITALTHPAMIAVKLVTNPCFSIFCGVIHFAGSRWSVFTSKSRSRTKSSFSLSVTGKTWTTKTAKELKDKTWKFIPRKCLVHGLVDFNDQREQIQTIKMSPRESNFHPGGLFCFPAAACLQLLAKQKKKMNKSIH